MAPRIVVVGSLMMDLVVRAPRLPVAGESLLSHSFQTFPGGKGGNQAVAAARLGASVAMVGKVGTDRFGAILRESLEAAGVDTANISVDSTSGTGVAVPIVLDSGDNAIFAIPQANTALGSAEIEAARSVIERADMLMVQFEVGMEATLAAMRIARAAGVRVMLNPAPIGPFPPEILRLASVIVANEVEAAALAPQARGDHADELHVLHANAPAVITLGSGGAMFLASDGSPGHQRAFEVTPVDSVGAGDAFCAGLAVALCEGLGFPEAVRFGQAAGALATTKHGAQAGLPARSEVEAFLAAHRGTFHALSASVDGGIRRPDTEIAPGLAH